MNSPYATAIVPTLNRASTLPVALRSMQQQTVKDLEIIVVLDGATAACRDVALAAARQDKRIRVLDLPKAPGSGKKNVNQAVMEARAPRIFYNDDDDIWLPHHVETLGPLLDDAHMADSRVATANREYELHLAPCPGANRRMRELLVDYRHKNLFDTHIAHTADAYRAFSTWLPSAEESPRPVWEFFRDFAHAGDCRWVSTGQVTAISLHGANRRDMSEDERAAEIGNWWAMCAQPLRYDGLRAKASSLFHLFRLLHEASGLPDDFDVFAAEFEVFEDVVRSPVARGLFALMRQQFVEQATALQIAKELSVATFVGYHTPGVVDYFVQALGADGSLALFRTLSMIEGAHQPGAWFALALLSRRAGDMASAVTAIEAAIAKGPDPTGQLAGVRAGW